MIFNKREVENALREWKKESGVKGPIMYDYDETLKRVVIHTSRPGFFIGKAGQLVNKYELILKAIMDEDVEGVTFKEVNYWV